jgi:hypothetical protein
MASAEAEGYRQLDRAYEDALADYERSAAEYREATQNNQSEQILKQRYNELAEKRRTLDSLYERLTQMRSELVDAPAEITSKVLL